MQITLTAFTKQHICHSMQQIEQKHICYIMFSRRLEFL